MLSTFLCICWSSICFLWRNIYLGHSLIFYWVVYLILNYMSFLYIFKRLMFYQLLHLQIFSPILRAVFFLFVCLICLWLIFQCKKLLNLIRPPLFILSLFPLLQKGVGVKEDLAVIMLNICISKTVLCFPLRVSFFGIIFRYLVHFEFIFLLALGSVLISLF